MTFFEEIKAFVKDADKEELAHFICVLRALLPECPGGRRESCTWGEKNRDAVKNHTNEEHTCEDCWLKTLDGKLSIPLADIVRNTSKIWPYEGE